MQTISIAGNEKSVMIHIDKSSVSEDRLREAINYLRLMLGDDSHIPSVDAKEQKEIESIFESMTEEDNEIALEKIIL